MSVIYKEPKTRTEIEAEADEIAKIRIKIRKLTVARDAAILKINEQYNPQIKALEAERDCRENALAPFVSARKEELMAKTNRLRRRFRCMDSEQGKPSSATSRASPTTP